MGRQEFKYLVPMSRLDSIRSYLASYLYPDPYAERQPDGQYRVRSLYFDTLSLDAYYTKLAGVRVRRKFRIRGYDDIDSTDTTFLEVKRKDVSVVSKSRFPVPFDELSHLLDTGDYGNCCTGKFIRQSASNFLYYYIQRNLRPVIKIIYDREAYFSRFDPDLRITFDKNICSSAETSIESLPTEQRSRLIRPGYFILEVKTTKVFPNWLTYMITALKLRCEALSKYTMGIDKFRVTERFNPYYQTQNRPSELSGYSLREEYQT